MILAEYRHDPDLPGKVHAIPGDRVTCCGYDATSSQRWSILGPGSVHDVTCRTCRASLRSAGTLK